MVAYLRDSTELAVRTSAPPNIGGNSLDGRIWAFGVAYGVMSPELRRQLPVTLRGTSPSELLSTVLMPLLDAAAASDWEAPRISSCCGSCLSLHL